MQKHLIVLVFVWQAFHQQKLHESKLQIIYTRLADMKPKMLEEEDESFQKPDEETIAQQTEATRLALEKITSTKVWFYRFVRTDFLKCIHIMQWRSFLTIECLF